MEVDRPLHVQSNGTVLLEVGHPDADAARGVLNRVAALIKSPEVVQTWRLTRLSLWDAAARGLSAGEILDTLQTFTAHPLPAGLRGWVLETAARWGQLRLHRAEDEDDQLVLSAEDPALLDTLEGESTLQPLLSRGKTTGTRRVRVADRGALKLALIRAGWPVLDQAGFEDGDELPIGILDQHAGGNWSLRDYQSEAVEAFLHSSDGGGGSGVVALPCGAGKTIVGIGAMARLGMKTLILCTNTTALRQWRDEIIQRTTLEPEQVGEYSGQTKAVRPVTLSTYQTLTWRPSKGATPRHFALFDRQRWGLVIYDEVHLLPAPVFRTVARLQAMRRLGLTATLIREDGREADVFALIGPKRYDLPWRELETRGWIAEARCVEVRVPLPRSMAFDYADAEDRQRHRLAATNPGKLAAIQRIVARHPDEPTLIIGMYLDQLSTLSSALGAPLITGQTRQAERDALFAAFRSGEERLLVLSRVGNFSVDLPDARVAIQVSGSWGSRQEEAQRLGRVLRPKRDARGAWFYSVVSQHTVEEDFSARRQRFLAEQGYQYRIEVLETP